MCFLILLNSKHRPAKINFGCFLKCVCLFSICVEKITQVCCNWFWPLFWNVCVCFEFCWTNNTGLLELTLVLFWNFFVCFSICVEIKHRSGAINFGVCFEMCVCVGFFSDRVRARIRFATLYVRIVFVSLRRNGGSKLDASEIYCKTQTHTHKQTSQF